MLFSSIFAVAAVLATSASAAVLARNKHVADFRIYGEAGCYAKNLGVWTVIDDDIQDNPCTIFHDHVESVTVIDIIDGCKLHVFADDECKTGGHTLQQGQCYDESDGLKAWSMECAY